MGFYGVIYVTHKILSPMLLVYVEKIGEPGDEATYMYNTFVHVYIYTYIHIHNRLYEIHSHL